MVLVAACGQKDIKDAKNWPVQDFTFKNQDNKYFGYKDLKGKIWISDFIYTSCTDICPPMTANLVKLQRMVKDAGLKNVEFVSFSVDPTVDSPEALRNFAKKFGADTENWTFLTGYSQKTIEEFALKNYKALVKKPETGDEVIHGIDFYLAGPDGKIKKTYTGIKDVPFDEIINDIKTLQ
jgi:protein SCO1/2